MTIEEWAKDFKSYINALDMQREVIMKIAKVIQVLVDIAREVLDVHSPYKVFYQDCDYKRREVPKDCLSCAQSFSADDENGNMILICVKEAGHHVRVQEDGHCEEWKD